MGLAVAEVPLARRDEGGAGAASVERGRRRRCAHAVFVFSPENIWDLRRASQRNPSIAFPRVPLPPPPHASKPAGPPHICIRMRSSRVLASLLQLREEPCSRAFVMDADGGTV